MISKEFPIERETGRVAALIAAGAAFSIVPDGGLVPSPVPLWMTLSSLAIQLAAYGINLFVALAPDRKGVEVAEHMLRPHSAAADA